MLLRALRPGFYSNNSAAMAGSAVAGSLRFVATGAEIPYAPLAVAAGRARYRTRYRMRIMANTPYIRLIVPAWYGPNGAETSVTSTANKRWSYAEYNGSSQPFAFSGVSNGYAWTGSGATNISDVLNASAFSLSEFTAGTDIWIREDIDVTVGDTMLFTHLTVGPTYSGAGFMRNSGTAISEVTGTGPLTVQTGDTDITSTVSLMPMGLLGFHNQPAVMIYGSSSPHGQAGSTEWAAGDGTSGFGSWAAQACYKAGLPYAKGAIAGATVSGYVATSGSTYTKRTSLAQYATHILTQNGINDLSASGDQKATLLANKKLMWALWLAANPSVKIIEAGLNPRVSATTDAYASVAGQTADANYSEIRNHNTDLIANVGSDGLYGYMDLDPIYRSADSPDVFIANGTATYATSDGQHPTVAHHGRVSDLAYPRLATLTSVSPPADTVPGAFIFQDKTGTAVSTITTSDAIPVYGLTGTAAISITGSGFTYNINGGSYVSTSSTVANGDLVRMRVTSSGSNITTLTGTLTIGGVSDSWSVTTTGGTLSAVSLGTAQRYTATAANITMTTSVTAAVNESIVLQGSSSNAPTAINDGVGGNTWVITTRSDSGTSVSWTAECLALAVAIPSGTVITATTTSSNTRSITGTKMNQPVTVDTSNNQRNTSNTTTARALAPAGTPTTGSILFTVILEGVSGVDYTETTIQSPWVASYYDNTALPANRRMAAGYRVVDNATGSNTLTWTPNGSVSSSYSSIERSYKA